MGQQPQIQLSKRQVEQLEQLDAEMKAQLNEVITNNRFPIDRLNTDSWHVFSFSEMLRQALTHEKPHTLQCPREVYMGVATKKVEDMNLQELGFAFNCIEDKTPAQLGIDVEQYVTVLEDVAALGKQWNEVLAELNKPVIDKYKAMMQRVKDNKPLFIPNTDIIH